MSRASGTFSLGRYTAQCASSGRSFIPGEPIVATLCEALAHVDAAEGAAGDATPAKDPAHEFVRLDFTEQTWSQGARPKGLVCFWRTTAPEPDQKRRLLVDDDTLLELFDRMEGDDRPQRVAYRWLLCLILLRKKLLRHVRVDREQGGEWWLVRKRGAADDLPPIKVLNPQIRDEDLQELAEHLGEVMQSEL
jgi:hypothetical protein